MELNKEAQAITGGALKTEVVKRPRTRRKTEDSSRLSVADRENIIKLSTQGWTKDELAKNFNVSIGEIELILELGPRVDK
jgi:hypothetical protein